MKKGLTNGQKEDEVDPRLVELPGHIEARCYPSAVPLN